MRSFLLSACFSVLLWLIIAPAHADSPETHNHLVVSPNGPYTTIDAALDAAHDGDTITVRGGTYRGPLVVRKSVTLEGVNYPVIDNGGEGTVVSLNAPGIVFRGFEARGSGSEYDRDHAGITITAPRVLVENNRIREALFGIFVAQASDVVLRGNDVTSKAQFDIARKGDAIRLWYSPRVIIERNRVHAARDTVIWYSSSVTLRENVFENGRYGIHLMYCNNALIERNRLFDNSVGIYTMYSNDSTIRENLIRGQRGPSGYALGFKDADNIVIENNVLVDNRGGVFLDGMPFSPQGYGRIHNNIIAFNDVGMILLPAVRGNVIENNTFWENVEQVAVQGGGNLGKNEWRGNYWSDYSGFDPDGDGRGDMPHRAERFFEGITDREPMLRMLIYSPAAQAIEFAGSAFPIVRPVPKFTDPTPSTQPLAIPAFAASSPPNAGMLTFAAVALLGVSGLFGALAWRGGNMNDSMRTQTNTDEHRKAKNRSEFPISVHQVTKRYGTIKALDAVSFEARAGEAIALWGPNGAGKTTLLKAILGLIDFQGQIQIAERDVRRAGKLARRSIGYVPQEAVFYDLTVRATLDLYARLKKADASRAASLLERVGLAEHADKLVPALSGGMKQRLALAIALLANPPVLLLDEPTANLDAAARRDYLALLASLHLEGKTMIFASHRIAEVETLADRALVIQNGRIEEMLTPQELRARLAPSVEMTLWIDESQRAQAVALLQTEGWNASANGRGTIMIQVRAQEKMRPLRKLSEQDIHVINFQIEEVSSWN